MIEPNAFLPERQKAKANMEALSITVEVIDSQIRILAEDYGIAGYPICNVLGSFHVGRWGETWSILFTSIDEPGRSRPLKDCSTGVQLHFLEQAREFMHSYRCQIHDFHTRLEKALREMGEEKSVQGLGTS